MTEIKSQESSYPEYPIIANIEKIENDVPKVQKMEIKNEFVFQQFLTYLYSVYRKIEIKLENAGYKVPESKVKRNSFVKTCLNLQYAKEKFELIKKDLADFEKVYSTLKNLYYSYLSYLYCCIETNSDIEEGDYLPIEVDELKSLLRNLDSWMPEPRIKDILSFPPGFQYVLQKLKSTKRFKNVAYFLDHEISEPILISESGEKTFFGFLDMSDGDVVEEVKNTVPLFVECPEQCSKVERKWICTCCGNFVSIKFAGKLILFCPCGSKDYNESLFICYHPSHVLNSESPEFIYSEKENALDIIRTQLEKCIKREKQSVNERVLLALETMKREIYTVDNEDIKDTLRQLQSIPLDGDTVSLINEYLE